VDGLEETAEKGLVQASTMTDRTSQAEATSSLLTGPRVVFVNGWNAWSFTGAVQQGDPPPAPGVRALEVLSFACDLLLS
jgi:hypothetical protein